MTNLVTSISTGVTAFTATNVDDLVILSLFFSQVNATFRRRHIFFGQYLGFSALVIASLTGFFGGLFIPHAWIGLLGLVPIALGVSRLLNREEDEAEVESVPESAGSSLLSSLLSPQAYGVAAVTVANGSDNIGIYVPLFASSELERLLVILGVFFLLVGVWCYAAYKLTSVPAIAPALSRYGNVLAPFVLIGLGVFIILESRLLESQTLTLISVTTICLCLIIVGITNRRTPEMENN